MQRGLDFVARLCLALVFAQSIPGKISGFDATAAAIGAKGVPAAPWLLGAAIALMAIGVLLLLLGRQLRLLLSKGHAAIDDHSALLRHHLCKLGRLHVNL